MNDSGRLQGEVFPTLPRGLERKQSEDFSAY